MIKTVVFKVIQREPKSHQVYLILGRFILKKYLSRERMERDLQGLNLWNNAQQGIGPRVYFHFGKFVIWEALDKSKSRPSRSLLERFTEMYADYYHNADDNPEESSYFLSWKGYLKYIKQFAKVYDVKLRRILSRDNYHLLEGCLSEVIRMDWGAFKMIPLHRDLHWDNIIVNKRGEMNLIDFEHFCIGPIEYEFTNCIFWNDQLSLDKSLLNDFFEKLDVPYSSVLADKLIALYFIEQCHLAFMNKDEEKVYLLSRKMNHFLDTNKKSLTGNFEEATIQILFSEQQQLVNDLLHLEENLSYTGS